LFFSEPVEHKEKRSHEMDQIAGYFIITVSDIPAAGSGGRSIDDTSVPADH
jgi:hypothetical protein